MTSSLLLSSDIVQNYVNRENMKEDKEKYTIMVYYAMKIRCEEKIKNFTLELQKWIGLLEWIFHD